MSTRKVILIIMDGWGWREEEDGNAVLLADTPNVDHLWKEYPHTLINGSGPFVGLPEGQMGNSEVGHLNLGAGRIVRQDFVRIDRAIAQGSFFENDVLLEGMNVVREEGTLHLIGLLSDGGVHSHEEHLYALLRMAAGRGVARVSVHAVLDGRDTPPHNGTKYIAALEGKMREIGVGAVATVVGRYYCMDRDRRWERTQRAYDLFTRGQGIRFPSAVAGVEENYANGVTDEFVEPIVVADSFVEDGDTAIFFNFRADRARQIIRAFNDDDFTSFERKVRPKARWICMTRYDERFTLPVAFPPETRRNILAEVMSAQGKKSLRIAETEKYAHVTYFFNGGGEREYPGEDRIMIPSPRVATYDLKPQMSAKELTDRLIDEIESDVHDYIICNYANADMVGHTGVLEAAVVACETVDACVGRVIDSLDLDRWVAIVTADHGNADEMIDYVNGGPHTAHTTNPVPCILVDPTYKGALIEGGALQDIAPTICNYLGVARPEEMTGSDLRVDY
ncbi:MAG: 2,3-bisphosphoglycerate-independent phosphoglycerate mutase [Candidatus Krumholzibacteriota bacterium]|nr:2,3-bisphosphoglycerate-independent phosphoglycerate mutase [Candidatus Krumholzibacteriota bacterium]